MRQEELDLRVVELVGLDVGSGVAVADVCQLRGPPRRQEALTHTAQLVGDGHRHVDDRDRPPDARAVVGLDDADRQRVGAWRERVLQRDEETVPVAHRCRGGKLFLTDLHAVEEHFGFAVDGTEPERRGRAADVGHLEVDPVPRHSPVLLTLVRPVVVGAHRLPAGEVGRLLPAFLEPLVVGVGPEGPLDWQVDDLADLAEGPVEPELPDRQAADGHAQLRFRRPRGRFRVGEDRVTFGDEPVVPHAVVLPLVVLAVLFVEIVDVAQNAIGAAAVVGPAELLHECAVVRRGPPQGAGEHVITKCLHLRVAALHGLNEVAYHAGVDHEVQVPRDAAKVRPWIEVARGPIGAEPGPAVERAVAHSLLPFANLLQALAVMLVRGIVERDTELGQDDHLHDDIGDGARLLGHARVVDHRLDGDVGVFPGQLAGQRVDEPHLRTALDDPFLLVDRHARRAFAEIGVVVHRDVDEVLVVGVLGNGGAEPASDRVEADQ